MIDFELNLKVETHPLEPFLPENAKVLMLGSFPPPQHRWKMPFYYPNLQNDMWRIMGSVFFQNPTQFIEDDARQFKMQCIIEFLEHKGIAIYDMAYRIRRLQDNAADQFLEVVEPTHLATLLKKIPFCQYILTTGDKATALILAQTQTPNLKLKIGQCEQIQITDRELQLCRMPSSSRAYPLAMNRKAEKYHEFFNKIGMLSQK